ncbi:MAG: hypothetical protein ACK55Z_00680, partial [bacterium]
STPCTFFTPSPPMVGILRLHQLDARARWTQWCGVRSRTSQLHPSMQTSRLARLKRTSWSNKRSGSASQVDSVPQDS